MKYPIPTLSVFIAVALTLLIGDIVWLGYIATPMYQELRQLLNPGISYAKLPYKILPAIAAYFVMTYSISTLAVPMVSSSTNITIGSRLIASFLWGGVWALGVYGTYDFTNMAIIQSFPTITGLIDLTWGILLGTLATFVGSYVN
jgi:uncharacterized membrane protein